MVSKLPIMWKQTVVPTAAPALPVATAATENETVGDRLWMWAHPAGFHDPYFPASKGFKPEGGAGTHTWRSRITPVEAAVRLDLHNIMFVYENTRCVHFCRSCGCHFSPRQLLSVRYCIAAIPTAPEGPKGKLERSR